jgi:Pentapeptide repeats (8 copies)
VLADAELQGADLSYAQLQGSVLAGVQLQGAILDHADLQVALLSNAQLQGASLSGVQLGGASLERVGIQGVDLGSSIMQQAMLNSPYVWRARNAACADAKVDQYRSDAVLPAKSTYGTIWPTDTFQATPESVSTFIAQSVADIPDPEVKEAAIDRMRSRLLVEPTKEEIAAIEAIWRSCQEMSQRVDMSDSFERRAEFLRNLYCKAKYLACRDHPDCSESKSSNAIAMGIIRVLEPQGEQLRSASAQLARGLLGEDGKPCPSSGDLRADIKERLRETISSVGPLSEPR